MKLSQLQKKKSLRVVGIMSGTSLDGIDYVLTDVRDQKGLPKVRFVSMASFSFSVDLKKRLQKAADHQLKVDELAILHHDLGRMYAQQLKKIKQTKKWKFDLIGLHGQTVFHAGSQATLQIGESSYLAQELKTTVISDFRVADLAVGGQGAPLASILHAAAYQSKAHKGSFSAQNIGGIGNCTLIDRKLNVIKAFDTGPGNMLMDLMIQKVTRGKKIYDESGKFAAQGIPDENLVDQVLNETKYFSKKAPKTCGREEFGSHFLEKVLKRQRNSRTVDAQATLLELTAKSIALAHFQEAPKDLERLIISGGGAKNPQLLRRIRYHMPKVKIQTAEDYGWKSEAIEGAAFALMAAMRIWEKPSNLPKATGAQSPALLGKIVAVTP